jgi:hypothetical protein
MTSNTNIDYSDEAEIKQLEELGKEIIGLKIDKVVKSGSMANIVGIQADHISFSQRLDSLTYIVRDDRYGPGKVDGIFEGSKREHLELGRMILDKIGIPSSEILDQKLLQEMTQVAEIEKETKKIRIEEAQNGRGLAIISRQIDNFPVWPSNFILGITKEKQVGYMQLHWPEIPKLIVRETHRLEYKLQHGWSPPKLERASVESVEAGIIHSPAISFFMDIYPVIRVIYAPDKGCGVKPMLYLDRDGNRVPSPRQIDLKHEEIVRRKTEYKK